MAQVLCGPSFLTFLFQSMTKTPTSSGPDKNRDDVLGLLKHVADVVKHLGPTAEFQVDTIDAHVLGMYVRSMRLYEGVVALLDRDLPEEALVLARSLFEESLRLMQLPDVVEERRPIVLGWANESLDRAESLFREAQRTGLDPNVSEVLEEVKVQRTKLQGYARRHGVGRFEKFKPVDTAALQLGRSDDYWTYLMSHQMVHGSEIAHRFSRRKSADDVLLIFAKTSDIDLLKGVGAFAAMSALLAGQAAGRIFKWQKRDDVPTLLQEVEKLSGR